MLPKLGILAGGGELPSLVIDACRDSGREFYVVALEGHCELALDDLPHSVHRMSKAGLILDTLKDQGVKEIVMAGAVRRPALRDVLLDRRSAALLLRIGSLALGDDGLLRGVSRVIEEHGFRVVGADSIVDDLLAPRGTLGSIQPDSAAQSDITLGIAAALELGQNDIGQAVIVRNGEVIDREDSEGTTAILERCSPITAEKTGVLVKMLKPGQDRRIDMPTIGPDTVQSVADAGLAGIAVEAGRSLILNRRKVVEAADHHGIFLVSVENGTGDKS